MIERVKTHLHDELHLIRGQVLAKLDGLSEYDVRRPLTPTGTNLLGLVKHLAIWEARYLGEVFGRPFPAALPRWDDAAARGTDMWATEHETRAQVVDRHHRVGRHSAATVDALALDAPGRVPWWPRPDVTLFGVLVHLLAETSRHAGHADILRERLDGVGPERGEGFWERRCADVERAARAAGPG